MRGNKVTVVVPIYNAEKYLEQTIDSIICQSYEDIEIILVNDGSTDKSQDIIDFFALKDSRIISITTENRGGSHARNVGLEKASGKYIVFFDADDVMLSDEIMLLQSKMRDDIDLVAGSYFEIRESGVIYRKNMLDDGIYNAKTADLAYLMHMMPFPDNKIFRLDNLKLYDIKFNDVKIGQDLDFYLRYLSICKKVVVIPESVCLYRIVSNSVSRTYNLNMLDIIKCAKNIEEFATDKRASEAYMETMYSVLIEHFYYQINQIKFMLNSDEKLTVIDEIFKATHVIVNKAKKLTPITDNCYKRICEINNHKDFYIKNACWGIRDTLKTFTKGILDLLSRFHVITVFFRKYDGSSAIRLKFMLESRIHTHKFGGIS